MTFKTLMSNDAKNEILDTSEYAESITYLPSGGGSKTINAIIVRERKDTNDQSRSRLLDNEAEIYVANDSTSGVTSVDYQGATADKVQFPLQPGDSNETWRVVAIISKDDGMWHLRVMK